jgi:hypothetical protein
MIRIGLISDTHGHFPTSVFKYFEECDEIWHAGDIGNIEVLESLRNFRPTRAVYGNIDGHDIRQETSEHLIFTLEGVKVLITHIGGYPGRYSPHARQFFDREKPTLFICGHSHILKVMPDPARPGLLHMNPGAAGIHGFHKVLTVLRFTIDSGKISNLQAIELGERGKMEISEGK